MQETHYQIKGMSQDLAYQLFNPQYAFECKNIRINTTDENSLLSLTNERGNKYVGYFIDQTKTNFKVLGIGQFSDYCIIFGTTGENINPDYIIKLSDNKSDLLLNGNFNFNKDYPIKTICVYENEKVQKVYWIDGINVPRVLNVAPAKDIKQIRDQKVDFLPKLTFREKVSINKTSGGIFPAGVIQYAFTYSDKNLQESNIWNVSPLYYITKPTRGAEAGDSCNTAFEINFSNIDTSFDYIQIYVMIRSSLNAVPQCYRVANISTSTTSFTDTGSYWETCDIAEVLGKQLGTFTPKTMASKDSTLFLGNYTIKSPIINKDNYIDSIANNLTFGFNDLDLDNNELKTEERSVKTFRSGEWYRFGIQFQDEYGTPSNVLYLKDLEAPISDTTSGIFKQKVIKAVLSEDIPTYITTKFKRFRLLMVDRTSLPHRTLCQGVLCPTVYTPTDRVNNAPFAMSSWCMRGYSLNHLDGIQGPKYTGPISWHSNMPLRNHLCQYGGELANQNLYKLGDKHYYDEDNDINNQDLIIVKPTEEDNVKYYYYLVLQIGWTVPTEGYDTASSTVVGMSLYKSEKEGLTYDDLIKDVDTEELTFRQSKALVAAYSDSWFSPSEYIDTYNRTIPMNALRQKISSSINLKNHAPHYDWVEKQLLEELFNGYKIGGKTLTEYGSPEVFGDPDTSPIGKGITRITVSAWDMKPSSFDDAVSVANRNINPFYCDHNIITFHSPDVIKYSTLIDNNPNVKYRAIGFTYMENSYLDTYISASEQPTMGTGIQSVIRNYAGGMGNSPLWEEKYLYPIYIWHRDKKLGENTSITWTNKIMANVHKCGESYIFKNIPLVSNNTDDVVFPAMGTPRVFNQDELGGLVLEDQPYSVNRHRKLTYFGNVKTLHSINTNYQIIKSTNDRYNGDGTAQVNDPCSIQYKSTPHVVMPMSYLTNNDTNAVSAPMLPFINNADINYLTPESIGYIWATSGHGFKYGKLNDHYFYNFEAVKQSKYPILYIAELYQDLSVQDIYGGTTSDSLAMHTWIPISDWVPLDKSREAIGYGDTFIGRWECLKTYQFSEDDSQSYLDITSFIVESDTNLSTRCDTYKETTNAATLDASKFNIFNSVYDQQNNLFSYESLSSIENIDNFQNQICWSEVKVLGEEVDSWCRINVGNNTDLQGEYGQLRSIMNFNNNLYCFQDNAVYKLNYNTRVAITPSDGGPIQLSNNYNIDPALLLSSNYGISDSKHVAGGIYALYFLDSKRKRLLSLDNKDTITELSTIKGINSLLYKVGTPTQVTVDTNIKDVYFNFSDVSIGYNEDLMEFSSLYDYHIADSIFCMNESSYTIKANRLYLQRQGNYGEFFGYKKPYYIELLMNEHPTKVKTFTNLEFNMDSDSADTVFDQISVKTSYQEAEETLSWNKLRPSNLKRKFRLWRIDIPRDRVSSFDRMRDTWCKVKLIKRYSSSLKKARLNHISISYNID